MTLLAKLFSFQGRLRRRDYWVLGFALQLVSTVFSEATQAALDTGLWDVRVLLAGAITYWPHYAISVKRMHDRGYSGWLVAICQVPLLALIVAMMSGASLGVVWALGFVALLPSLFLLVQLGFMDGTEGTNVYGPTPKGY